MATATDTITISKRKHGSNMIPFITVAGVKEYTPTSITDEFGRFYSSMGKELASKIPSGKHDINHYLSKIPRSKVSLVMHQCSKEETEKIIDQLLRKSSSGHDRISNVLLKELSYPLMLIFNQLLLDGKFPNMMKIAEVIPLFKGKEHDLVINY